MWHFNLVQHCVVATTGPQNSKAWSARRSILQLRYNLISTAQASLHCSSADHKGALKNQAILGLNSKDSPNCMVYSSCHCLDLVPPPIPHWGVVWGESFLIFILSLVFVAWQFCRTSWRQALQGHVNTRTWSHAWNCNTAVAIGYMCSLELIQRFCPLKININLNMINNRKSSQVCNSIYISKKTWQQYGSLCKNHFDLRPPCINTCCNGFPLLYYWRLGRLSFVKRPLKIQSYPFTLVLTMTIE